MATTLKEFFIHALHEADAAAAPPPAAPVNGAPAFSKVDPAAAGAQPAFQQVQQQALPAESLAFFGKQKDAILGHLGELGGNPAVSKGLDALMAGLDEAAYALYTVAQDKTKFSESWSKAASGIMSSFSGIGKSFESLKK